MSRSSGRHRASKQQRQPSAALFDDTSDTAAVGYSPSPTQFYDPNSHQGQGPAVSYGDPYGSSAYQPSYQPQYPPTSQQQQQPQQQQPYQPNFMPAQLLNNPMVNDMAMQYGQQVFGQGSQYVQENLNKYVASSRIKYYFAVDNAYVGKKLLLLLFPYINKNWSLTYNSNDQDGVGPQQQSQTMPVAPRFDVNAPDLYIPVMAFVTYILLSGVAMGVGNRFTPEQLGVQTSTALVWLLVEILALLLTFYIFNLNSRLRYLDLVAYAGYKYVGMIAIVLSGLIFKSIGFYAALVWCGAALAFFLIRTLNFQIQAADQSSSGHKRRLYMLLFVAALQPLFMWLLTARVLS